MSRVRVRTAREADVPAIEELAARTARHGVPTPTTDWPTVVSALGAVVALLDDRIAGVLVVWPHPDHVLVERLSVSPEARGAGAGDALLDRAELLAIELGTNEVRLAVAGATPGVLAFAASRGFVAREDGGVLEKRLG